MKTKKPFFFTAKQKDRKIAAKSAAKNQLKAAEQRESIFDSQGSYTGVPYGDALEIPQQDADDL